MNTRAAHGAEAYRQADVTTRSPLELVVMLYDGLLTNLRLCREATAAGDLSTRAAAISKSLAIVGHLQSTLNVESGGQIATELDRLYTFAMLRITDANVQRSVEPLEEVRRLIAPLRDAWAEIAQPALAKERT